MTTIRIGLLADPAAPTRLAHELAEVVGDRSDGGTSRVVEVVSEPFTTGSEDVGAAMSQLRDRAREQGWDVVVGITDLPLRGADGRYLAVESDERTGTAVLSVPALGGVRVRGRARDELERLLGRMTPGEGQEGRGEDGSGAPSRAVGRARLLLGMTLANRPWRLVPGLRSALVAALATGAIATINSTVWLLASSLSTWRLLVATLLSVILVVGWLIVDGELWDRPEDDSVDARERSRLYNTSTVLTLSAGAVLCYGALYVVNVAWGFFVLDPSVMGEYVRLPLDHGDLLLLAWFVTSAATVGGALGSGFETNDAIRAATYSQREQERRRRLAEDS